MSRSLRSLHDLKPSGFKQIGHIPVDWKVIKTSRIFKIGMGETILKENLIDDGKYPVYSATEEDVNFGYVNEPKLILKPGDLVLPARGNSIGFVKLVKEESTTTQTTIYCKKRNTTEIIPKYIYYYMVGLKDYLFWFTQTAIPQITVDEVSSNPLLIPPLAEQKLIVDFLDRETAKIDELIQKQEKLIEFLEEKKHISILEVMSSGLNKTTSYNESTSIFWAKKIPKHWGQFRAKFIFEIKKRIAGELGYKVLSITQRGIKVKDTESNEGQLSMDYSKYQIVEPGDFAMNHMDLLTGYVDISSELGVTSPDYRVFSIRDEKRFFPEFYLLILQLCYKSKLFYPFGQGAAQLGRWRLPTDAFNNFIFPVPPISEQREICQVISSKNKNYDALISKAEISVQLFKEHRASLISAAVIGKIDVRNINNGN